MFLLNFLHNYYPDPIFFQAFGIKIYWYGLLIVVGILFAWFITLSLCKKINEKVCEHIQNLSFYLIIFGIIGARLYHVLAELPYYLKNPFDIFKIWQGGMGIFGAVCAGIIVVFLYCRKHKLSFLLLADLMVPGLILAQAIGRWGNYFNSELYGLPTSLSWGIPIINKTGYFHPAFLYESLFNIMIFLILILIYKLFKYTKGVLFSTYLILYSLGRFLIEFTRMDLQQVVFGLRLAQIVSIFVFIIGIILLLKQLPKLFVRQLDK